MLLPCKSWAEIITDNETGLEYDTETQAITGIGNFTGTSLIIPYVINENYYVKSIAENAFAGANITSVAFKDFSLKISNGAFKGSKLKSVSLSLNVQSIGDEAFADCSDLKEFTIGNNFTLSQNYNSTIFGDKGKLNKDFKIFVSSDMINTYKNSWTDFADYFAVDHASMLSYETNYSEGGITITGFKYGIDLTEDLVIPASIDGQIVTSIGLGAFMNDQNFEGSDLEGLKSVVIPATVKTIGMTAFHNCRHLTSVTFAEDCQLATISQYAFSQCDKLTNINLPASVQTIGEKAFLLTGLSSIKLPASLQTIGSGAFARTKLKSVNIPASVQSIGEGEQTTGVFDNCQDLTIVRLLGTISTINANTFNNMPSLMGIIVNKDAYNYYTSLSFVNNDKLIDNAAESVLTLTDDEGFQYSSNAVYFPANMLTYSRTMQTPGEYATLCLPFDFKLSDANGAFETAYMLKNQIIHFVPTETGKNDNNWEEKFILMLKEVSQDTSIPANTPLFVKMAADKQSFSLANTEDMVLYASKTVTPTAMEIVDWDGTSGLMKENANYEISYGSSYKPLEASEQANLYTFNTDGTFGPQTAGTYKPFRLGLTVNNKNASMANALSITIGMADGSTTAIREITLSKQGETSASTATRGIVFDLSGRKVGTEAQKNSLSKGVYILNGKKFVVK